MLFEERDENLQGQKGKNEVSEYHKILINFCRNINTRTGKEVNEAND